MSKAVVFFAEGTEECEALLVVDLLRRAKVEVTVASATDNRAITSSHKVHILADALAEDIDYSDVDLVVLPGGIPGTPNLAANKTVTDTCVSFARSGKKVAAICAAPSVLASLGLLEGKTPPPMPRSRTSWPAPRYWTPKWSWMAISPPATAWAVPFPLRWSWCASWRARPKPTASRRPLPTGTERRAVVCALSPAACRTA